MTTAQLPATDITVAQWLDSFDSPLTRDAERVPGVAARVVYDHFTPLAQLLHCRDTMPQATAVWEARKGERHLTDVFLWLRDVTASVQLRASTWRDITTTQPHHTGLATEVTRADIERAAALESYPSPDHEPIAARLWAEHTGVAA